MDPNPDEWGKVALDAMNALKKKGVEANHSLGACFDCGEIAEWGECVGCRVRGHSRLVCKGEYSMECANGDDCTIWCCRCVLPCLS